MQLTSLQSVNHLPELKRVESAGNIAEESDEERQMVRGKHILGSGRDLLEFGKINDQPEKQSQDDSYDLRNVLMQSRTQPVVVAKKPEFGQIRSEASGQSGPSKRSDRQYKPF